MVIAEKIMVFISLTFLLVLACSFVYGISEAIFLSQMHWFWKGVSFFATLDVFIVVNSMINKGYKWYL